MLHVVVFFFTCWQAETIRCRIHEGSSWKSQHCPCDRQGRHTDTEGERKAEEKSRSNTSSWKHCDPYNVKAKYKVNSH